LIGSVIGKGGAKIRSIQEISGARMVASKEMLPQSTERIVEVTGSSEAVRLAVGEIAKCLIEDWERSQGTVLYHPGAEGLGGATAATGGAAGGNGYPASGGQGFHQRSNGGAARSGFNQGGYAQAGGQRREGGGGFQNGGGNRRTGGQGQQGGNNFSSAPQGSQGQNVVGNESDPNWREQKISIPSDMVYVLTLILHTFSLERSLTLFLFCDWN